MQKFFCDRCGEEVFPDRYPGTHLHKISYWTDNTKYVRPIRPGDPETTMALRAMDQTNNKEICDRCFRELSKIIRAFIEDYKISSDKEEIEENKLSIMEKAIEEHTNKIGRKYEALRQKHFDERKVPVKSEQLLDALHDPVHEEIGPRKQVKKSEIKRRNKQ